MIRIFFKLDWILITAIILLLILSLSVLYPISYGGETASKDRSNFFRQLIFAAIGIVVFFTLSFFDYRIIKGYSASLFVLGILLLAAVLILGKTIRGTVGWIGFPGFHLQPVELFKVILAIMLAKYLSVNSRTIKEFRHILITLIPVGLSTFLILKQPDLGSALVVVSIWLGLLIISGIKKRYLLILLVAGLAVSMIAWGFLLKDYQRDRINSLFNPSADPLGAGYNAIQSTVAVGSGGIWGKGLGHGSQSQLNFLPEKHTDFIFAVTAEEMGLGGVLFVLFLLSLIIIRLFGIAQKSQGNFGKLLVSGIAIMIFVQSVVNIGMNIGVVPITGIPLPLLSYGGSALITTLAALGIAQSVHRRSKTSFG
ncbi:MAG: rod shape-determining protein RodA [Candidatus Moranbacteria bacterium]|nr:rod shape-determining protein RodA [Candidatus Moranbacteria bacterium]